MAKPTPWNIVDESKQPAPAATNAFNSTAGPPCACCEFWKPQVKFIHTASGYQYDGVRCCHADEMHPDFSCFYLRAEGPSESP